MEVFLIGLIFFMAVIIVAEAVAIARLKGTVAASKEENWKLKRDAIIINRYDCSPIELKANYEIDDKEMDRINKEDLERGLVKRMLNDILRLADFDYEYDEISMKYKIRCCVRILGRNK